ncbi:MspA family protein [Mycobacterium sp. CBMA 234]|uniref:MspA family porin n=1 Tax=Mycolicibacterium sp. CBMA 234 TaxID=1918495 RepID=UPI001EE3AC71|nr:MspA family porin [Mycolicibacterium sp. CBMA 234]MUL63721.1 MspA family protein [Mycolicibacterium sp. CBMA 234]
MPMAAAHADVVPMAPQVYDKVTRDGWHLQIKIDHEAINSVPNLAAAANSREAFVTASGTASATGGSSPITDSLFIMGYQLGCQSDVSTGLQLGGTAGVAPSAGIGTNAGLGVTGGLAGFVQTVLQPGVIVDLPLANMALSDGGQGMLDIDNIHVKADACGGDVTIRSYAYLRISTAAAHTEFAVYGDPMKI